MKKNIVLALLAVTTLSANKVVTVKQSDTSKKTELKKKIADNVVEKKQSQQKNETPKKLVLEDEIAVIIHTSPEQDPILLTRKELNRLSINGTAQTEAEIIRARKIEYEGVYVFKMPIPDEAITGYMRSLKEAHGMTDDQFKQKFEDAGYSYEEGIDELRRMLIVDQLFNFKIKSRLVVPESDVREYYEKNPQEIPAAYNIRQGFLSNGILTEEEIKELTANGKHSNLVDWMSPYWRSEDDLAESLKHMKTLPDGSIAAVLSTGNGYEVIQLVKKRPKRKRTFEESYKEIVDILQRPLFEKLVKEYEQELDQKYEVERL